MATAADVVTTLEVLADVAGWRSYRLHGAKTNPSTAQFPDLELVRGAERLVIKVQSEATAKKQGGLSAGQQAHLDAMAETGAEALLVTTAFQASEVAGALSVVQAVSRIFGHEDPS